VRKDWNWAKEQLIKGRAVRKRFWDASDYIYCNPQCNRILRKKYPDNYEILATDVLMSFDEWELFEQQSKQLFCGVDATEEIKIEVFGFVNAGITIITKIKETRL